jgi:hypothetical protein
MSSQVHQPSAHWHRLSQIHAGVVTPPEKSLNIIRESGGQTTPVLLLQFLKGGTLESNLNTLCWMEKDLASVAKSSRNLTIWVSYMSCNEFSPLQHQERAPVSYSYLETVIDLGKEFEVDFRGGQAANGQSYI